MKSSPPQRTLHPFSGCMTVSIVEDAHTMIASTTSTVSNHSNYSTTSYNGDNGSELLMSAQWEATPVQRKRASSFESWLHKTLQKDDDPQTLARRAVRRAKRRVFFRKLFGRSSLELAGNDEEPPRRSFAVDLSARVPEDERSAYRLDEIYYASMTTILDQYRPEKDVHVVSDDNAATSRISLLDLEDDEDTYGNDPSEIPEADIVAVRVVEKEVESPEMEDVKGNEEEAMRNCYVTPPVRVPFEYTLQDRRSGTLVAGHRVLFTSAAFKRKQRQFLYAMRGIPEDTPLVVVQVCASESDDENADDGNLHVASDWI